MKTIFFIAGVWALCGLIGDVILDARGRIHWEHVAAGPVTMAHAFVGN